MSSNFSLLYWFNLKSRDLVKVEIGSDLKFDIIQLNKSINITLIIYLDINVRFIEKS